MIGRALLRLIGFYSRAISPALPARCRFYPTCSAYAAEAIARHGAARGSWLAVRRLGKCAPWHPGGIDLVPERRPAPADTRGTAARCHSSSTAAGPPVAPHAGAHTTERATRPASRRTPQEESSVA
jgi:putative membrane protein insertion efficiency factor